MTERNVDVTGRIVIPKEMLRDLGITSRSLMEINRVGDKIIICEAAQRCKWCRTHENLIKGFPVCRNCAEKVSDLLKLS